MQSALDEWKAARILLTDAIQSYLFACSALRAICALDQSSGNTTIKELLLTVDSELASLASEEEVLRDMRVSLATMRKNSQLAAAPVNALPPEILARVLAFLLPRCARNCNNNIEFHDPAAVCVYWRRVALNRTELWTHIDAGPDTSAGLTDLLLGHTRDSPILVHVSEPANGTSEPTSVEQVEKIIDILSPYVHRVRALDISSDDDFLRLVTQVSNLWLDHGNMNLSKSLAIYHPVGDYGLDLSKEEDEETAITQSENAEGILGSLTTLHLKNADFWWDSCAYHGLVDLRLAFKPYDQSLGTWQFAGILSASPRLAILKLENLAAYPEPDLGQPTPVPMNAYGP
ncbi:hypothetical protein FRC07_003883 [Ceratobasidium sp. 392]|nr:hypothetical protein FRC07_003883 [Ceratobasidium sp. 392]